MIIIWGCLEHVDGREGYRVVEENPQGSQGLNWTIVFVMNESDQTNMDRKSNKEKTMKYLKEHDKHNL